MAITDWKKILPGVTTMEVMQLPTPDRVQLSRAVHLFITTGGTATIEGTALGDDHQTPQARPTPAVWVNATADTDIVVDPDPEWTAVHYTLDCAENQPALTDWQTQWAAEVDCLDDTLTPQTMEPAGRAARTHRGAPKHTPWHYPTTIHPEAVTQIKEALSLNFPDTNNAHEPGMFMTCWNFPTNTGMVPQVAEPTLPPTCTALAKAAEAMAHREGAQQDCSNAPTTTPTKQSRQGTRYTNRCETKTGTFSTKARGWYTSS